MADYNSLKATIDANIRANGVQAITGPVLNACLKAMITVLGNGYQLQGSIAQPGDDPSVPDARVAYVASGPGTYTDFGGLVIPDDGHAYMLTWDTQWTAVQLPVPTSAALSALATVVAGKQDILTFDPSPVSGSQNPVTSGGIFSAIESAKGAAGLAEALLDTDSAGNVQEFSLRKSGGDGGAYHRVILGNSNVWNQLMVHDAASGTTNDITFTNNGDGSWSLSGTASAQSMKSPTLSTSAPNLIAGHKYLLKGCPSGGNSTTYTLRDGSGSYQDSGEGKIFTAASSATTTFFMFIRSGVDTTGLVFRPQLIDLTLMFGAGNEPTTPEEFREKYPLLYYAYGRKLIHCKVAKVITKGANQWDEMAEDGGISAVSGQDSSTAGYRRSKNYIPVIGGATYYIKAPVSMAILFYGQGQEYLGATSVVYGMNRTFTAPGNAGYIRFRNNDANSWPTYNHDVCINLSDAEINGQYFPYWERELALDITNQEDTDGNKPFAEGFMSAGSAADYANEVGGAKVMGKVKFSDLEWSYDSTSEYFSAIILDMLSPSTNAGRLDGIVCSAYPVDTIAGISISGTDKTCKRYNLRIYVKDTAYTDAITFKAAMGDAELVYEKATPVPFTWKEPLNTGIKVSKYGTEEITPAQTENIDAAPFRAVTTYSISVANLIAALSALGNRGGAKGLLGGGNQEENPGNGEGLTPEEESPKEDEQPKEEEPKEEETPVVEPEVQNKK